MNWVSSHPYLASSVFAIVMLLVGTTLVVQRSATTPLQYQPSTWVGTNGITATPVVGGGGETHANPYLGGTDGSYHYVSPFGTAEGAQANSPGQTDLDYDQITQMLTHQPSTSTVDQVDVSSAYEFIPNGLLSLPDSTSKDTPEQAKLRSYGNDIGAIIQSFEQSNPDQVATLKNYMEDRNDPDKIAAMKKLGAGLSNIGTLIEQEDPVPSQMKSPQAALAAAYHEIGNLLAAVPDAKGDSDTYDAIVTYDQAAERFVGKFVSFALLFPASGVNFSQDESGSIFMFQQTGGGL